MATLSNFNCRFDLLRTFLPILIIFTLNIILIKYLFLSRTNLRINNYRKEIQFTLIVILSNLVFLLFNSPLSIVYIVFDVCNLKLEEFKIMFFKSFAIHLAFFYQSFSFFFNIILNTLFRNEILIVLRIRKKLLANLQMNRTNSRISRFSLANLF